MESPNKVLVQSRVGAHVFDLSRKVLSNKSTQAFSTLYTVHCIYTLTALSYRPRGQVAFNINVVLYHWPCLTKITLLGKNYIILCVCVKVRFGHTCLTPKVFFVLFVCFCLFVCFFKP
jgi:hypothetical protein